MAVFMQRSLGYKLGMVTIVLGCHLHLIGFASPYWTVADDGTSSFNQGLWILCVSSPAIDTCVKVAFTGNAVWFNIVRLLEAVGLVMFFVSCAYGFAVNCCATDPTHTRILEGISFVGGLAAFSGAMVFMDQMESIALFKPARKMGWAFFLTALGSGLAVLASILVFATNKPLDAQTTGPVGMTNVGGVPSAAVVTSDGVQSAPSRSRSSTAAGQS